MECEIIRKDGTSDHTTYGVIEIRETEKYGKELLVWSNADINAQRTAFCLPYDDVLLIRTYEYKVIFGLGIER